MYMKEDLVSFICTQKRVYDVINSYNFMEYNRRPLNKN